MIEQSLLTLGREASDGLNSSLPIQQTLSSQGDVIGNAQALFIQQIKKILQLRWPESKFDERFSYAISSQTDVNSSFFGVIKLQLTCRSTAEAVLTAEIIEISLAQTYQIKSRISTQNFPVNFTYSKNPLSPEMTLTLNYRPVDYVNVHEHRDLNCDQQLMNIFKEPKNDYYDYFALRENIPNTRLIESSREILDIRQDLQEVAKKAINNDGPCLFPLIEYKAKILFITAIGLGSGNYMHALRVIKQLSEKMPQLQIDWILADYDLPTPKAGALPPQVTLHQSRMLYQQFPLIQSLSLTVDVIIGLPNNFLEFLQVNFFKIPMLLSNRCPYLLVSEYNIDPRKTQLSEPLYDVNLRSGINTEESSSSLGIIKPDCMQFPVERNIKRQVLQKDSQCAIIFADNPEAPLYFSYVYAPKTDISDANIIGLQNIDVLAFFIQYAKRRDEHHIKVMLSIRAEDIQKAKKMYPSTFSDCTIQLYSQQEQVQDILADEKLVIQVYDIFPFENEVFRALSDYASSWDTPVVMTGDQSFLELFFTENNQPVALYQLLSHKTALFQAIQKVAELIDAKDLLELFKKIESRIDSEERLVALTEFVLAHYENLKLQFQTLKLYIQQQPDLVDSLTRVIPTVIKMNRRLLQENKRKKEEAIDLFGEAFEELTEDNTVSEAFIQELQCLNDRVTPAFGLKKLLTEYYRGELLFAPLISHSQPELFNDLYIYLIQLNENILSLSMTKNPFDKTLLEQVCENKTCYRGFYTWLLNNKPALLKRLEKEYLMLKELQIKTIKLCENFNFQKIPTLLKDIPGAHACKIIIMNDQEIISYILGSLHRPDALFALKFFIDQYYRVLEIPIFEQEGSTLFDYLCDDPDNTYINLLWDIQNRYEKKLSEYQLIKLLIKLKHALEKGKSNDQVTVETIASTLEIKSHPLITQATLAPYSDSDSPWQLDNPALLDLINTDATIESIILDAIIDRNLRNPLMERGILVLPTQRSTEVISLELLNQIKQGIDLNFLFTVGIEVLQGQVEAIVAEKACSRPNYIVYPINIEELVHFGMLIIDISDLNAPISAAPAYYIEPLQWINKMMHFTATENMPVSQPVVNEKFYQDYVNQLNAELKIAPDSFKYIHLGQEPNVNYCADYVLSVLMLLAKGEINLAEPHSLMNLQGRHLTKSDAQAIRLLTIQQFGKDYLRLQLRDEMKIQNIDPILNAAEKKLRARTASDQPIDNRQADDQPLVKRNKNTPKNPSPLRRVENAASLLFFSLNCNYPFLDGDVFETKNTL